MTAPGPSVLGRGVVVDRNGAVPPPWAGVPTVCIDDAVLADPAVAVDALHRHWVERRPVVIELSVDPAAFREPTVHDGPPYELDPSFELSNDRLHFLVWANTYDARKGDPVWWWGRKAARLGATEGCPADVVLDDGRPAWVDGGPRQPLDLAEAVVHSESVELGRLTEARHSPPATVLAPDQLEAVGHLVGPARVLAPAGSGKTRVLTERLRHLIVDRGVERELVTAVAYNKRAAAEMVARTTDFRPQVRTLHSLGLAVLNAASPRRVLDERDVRRLLDDLVQVQHRTNTDPYAPFIEALGEIRLGLRTPRDVEAERDDVPGLTEAFPRYRARLAELGAVDFDEQIYGAIELLLRDPAARARARASCRHLLVDELQDLTPAFLLLVRLLAAPALDVFGVGDEDQVIYGYSGADPGFLLDYDRYFPGATGHALEVNYRCPPAVVSGARTLLGYNHRRIAKTIHAGPGRDDAPDQLRVVRHTVERGALEVVSLVTTWHDGGVALDDVAVLTRVNSALLPVHVALAQAGVPIRSTLGPEVLQRTGVRAALAWLRLGADPDAMAAADVVEVLRRPSRGFSRSVAGLLGKRSRWSLRQLRGVDWNNPRDASKFPALLADIEAVAKAVDAGTTADALAVVRDQIDLGGAMTLLDSSRGAAEGSTHGDDLDALVQVAHLHPEAGGFEAWLGEWLRRAPADRDTEGCTLSTVHRVKGMEWPRVVLFGANAGLLPHRLAADVEEERRIFHVAITRAGEQAVVLADEARPSPFLDELAGTAVRGAPPPARPARARPEPKPVRTGTLEARPGLEIEAPGGSRGTISELADDHAVVTLADGSTLRVRYGETVTIRGRTATLVARPDLAPEVEQTEEALRAWRTERCRRDKVSAFIVLSNAVLRAVATARPTTLAELAAVDGIGPTKLEQYGDEILGVLADLPPS